jgi:RNA polymerase sigma-70 factor (ECF subfamily)
VSDSTTEIGGAGRRFPDTSWTLICNARGEGPEVNESLNRLIGIYWKPVYWYVRTQWRKSNEDAKDLTQEFFATLIDRKILDDLREERPRFRTFLRACLEHFLLRHDRDGRRIKRGGAAVRVPIDPARCQIDVATKDLTPEQAFDEAWAQTLLHDAIDALERHYRSTGREDHWRIFERYHLAPESATYKACAAELGISPDDVQNRLRAAREKLRELTLERVRETVAAPEDLEAEMRLLTRGALRG